MVNIKLQAYLLLFLTVVCPGYVVATETIKNIIEPILIVHGGAGTISESDIPAKIRGVKLAAQIGYEKLVKGRNALDAVEAAVNSMEKDEYFNAGYGAVLTFDAEVEADASIMDGRDLSAGCVSIAKDILHPISLAKTVMTKTNHNYLAGKGLMKFAKEQGIEILPPGSLVTKRSLKALEDYKNSLNHTNINNVPKVFGEPGTVGAVAIDSEGNIAAATSTGGITGKLPGRIGDTPILGSGNYADNILGGISATGDGESIMKYNVAQKILQLMYLKSLNIQSATNEVLTTMTERLNGTAGVIGLDPNGNVGIFFTSKQMSWAYKKKNCIYYGISKDDFYEECISN